jgi:2-enoate reductase
MNLLNRWYQTQLSKLGVTVEVNTKLDAQTIKARKPQAVVLALGAEPVIPNVPGIQSPKVVDCVTALMEKPDLGQNVVVVGGGLVGCETAVGYAQEGKTVTLVEALPKILSAGIPVPESHDQMLRDLLAEGKVSIMTSSPLEAVTEEGAVVNGQTIPADAVVLAVGFSPRTSLASGLYGSGMEIYQVGDGSRVGSVMTAVADGYTIGRKI